MPKPPPRFQISVGVPKAVHDGYTRHCADTGRNRTSFLCDVVAAMAEAKSPEDFNSRCLAVIKAARGGKP